MRHTGALPAAGSAYLLSALHLGVLHVLGWLQQLRRGTAAGLLRVSRVPCSWLVQWFELHCA